LCGSEEFHGLEVLADPDGAVVNGFFGKVMMGKI
jgi:hypothetical protein